MNDMVALATAYLALIALLIGHSIHTSRRLKMVEERLYSAVKANERLEKKMISESKIKEEE
jgi:uncharacterized Rmd1/YagE family protein